LDTTTGFETGRYKFCSNPSRTAVGFFGNGWVACRSDGGRVARILNFEGECKDSNGNGVIDTSRDLNNDHVISGGEMLPEGEDECVSWTNDIGSQWNSNVARALGVHTDGYGWVGLWEAKRLVQIAPEDGAIVNSISIPANPYGLAIDKEGTIWVSGRGGGLLVKVVPATGQVSSMAPPGGFSPYGIALDEFGRVWTADCCGNHAARMYDPKTGQWSQVAVKARPRGLVANMNGRIFVANDQSHQVAVIDMNAMKTINYIDLGGGRFPLGMAIDAAGFVWAVNQQSGSVHKINSFSLEKVGEYPVGSGPYTYSDMTGSAFFDAVPPGWYRHRFEAAHVSGLTGLMAMSNAQWGDLVVDYVAPPGAYVKFRVRTGETIEEIEASLWTPLVGPFPDQVFPVELSTVLNKAGHFLDVEVWLYPSKDGAMPILKGMSLKYEASP
jgi:sugar lactone lactonase YvrE